MAVTVRGISQGKFANWLSGVSIQFPVHVQVSERISSENMKKKNFLVLKVVCNEKGGGSGRWHTLRIRLGRGDRFFSVFILFSSFRRGIEVFPFPPSKWKFIEMAWNNRLRFAYSWRHRLLTLLYTAKMRIHQRKDDGKIKRQINLDCYGPIPVPNIRHLPQPLVLITDHL
jgi:hypothetical protein